MFSKNTMFSVGAAGFLRVSTGFLWVSTGFLRVSAVCRQDPAPFSKKKKRKIDNNKKEKISKVSPGLALHQKERSDSSTPFKLVRYDLAPVFRCLLL